jgi:hypothetical protein
VIQQRLGAGVKVTIEVMPVPGEVPRKEGYWSVKRDDKQIIQIIRGLDGAPEGARPATVIVWTPEIPTEDGIKVGDTVAMLLAKVPNLVCKHDAEGTVGQSGVPAVLECRGYDGALSYIVNAQKTRFRHGVVKASAVQDLDIVAIAHEFEY